MKHLTITLIAVLFMGISAIINPIQVSASSDYEAIKAEVDAQRQQVLADYNEFEDEFENESESCGSVSKKNSPENNIDHEAAAVQIEEHRQEILDKVAEVEAKIEKKREKIETDNAEIEKSITNTKAEIEKNSAEIEERSSSLKWLGNIFKMNPVLLIVCMFLFGTISLIFRSVVQYMVRKCLIKDKDSSDSSKSTDKDKKSTKSKDTSKTSTSTSSNSSKPGSASKPSAKPSPATPTPKPTPASGKPNKGSVVI